ncbi:MAG: hypothetical protein AB1657_03230 [Candidatus Micrarchaeota archaeon]
MTEEKRDGGAPSPEAQNMLYFWGVGGLVIGLIIGFLVFPGMAPAAQQPAGNVTGFTPNQAKIDEIGGFLENYYFASTGQATTAAFSRYVDKGAYVELYYDVAGQEMPVYISPDYRYFYGGVFEAQATIEQMRVAREQALQQAEAEAQGIPRSDEPQVLMFVMSYCPYGNQAEGGLAPVVELLAEEAEFEPVYIVYPSGRECAENNGTQYCSLHGNAELWQDAREKIIFNMYGERKWAEYVSRANTECSLSNIDTCWETVADEVGVNKSAVAAEFEASKFPILDAEMAKTAAYGVSGSPTILINGYAYSGARTPEAYKSSVCEAFNSAPEGCSASLSSAAAPAASGSCG